MKIRWLREVDLESTFVAEAREAGAVRIYDDSGALVAEVAVS